MLVEVTPGLVSAGCSFITIRVNMINTKSKAVNESLVIHYPVNTEMFASVPSLGNYPA